MTIEYKIIKSHEEFTALFVPTGYDDRYEKYMSQVRIQFKHDVVYPNRLSRDEYHMIYAIDTDNTISGIPIIVGVVELRVSGNESLMYPGWSSWISSVDVHEDYRMMGIGSKLLDTTFSHAKELNIRVLISGYTLLGFMYMKPVVEKMAKKYGVCICDDRDHVEFPDYEKYEGFDKETYTKLVDRIYDNAMRTRRMFRIREEVIWTIAPNK